MTTLFYRFLYRPLMKFAHRFNWHYAPPCYPDGDTLLVCSWCGLSHVKSRAVRPHAIGSFGCGSATTSRAPEDGQ